MAHGTEDAAAQDKHGERTLEMSCRFREDQRFLSDGLAEALQLIHARYFH